MSRIEKALERASRVNASSMDGVVSRPESAVSVQSRLPDVAPLVVTNPLLTAAGQTNAAVNEEYNKLRSLIVSLTAGNPVRNTLLVTSAVNDEGKTLTALNLSFALAREYDHTVLLVDTDLRRPSVHTYLGIEPKLGLIQCLRNEAPLHHALITTGIGKLAVLPAGGTVNDPVELLSSNRMREIILELKNRYPERFVIFDTPPALSLADAQVLSGFVDGVIFVVREGTASKKQISKTLECFHKNNLLGVVYNSASTIKKSKSYY